MNWYRRRKQHRKADEAKALLERPWCEGRMAGCVVRAHYIHHGLALCFMCRRRLQANPKLSREMECKA